MDLNCVQVPSQLEYSIACTVTCSRSQAFEVARARKVFEDFAQRSSIPQREPEQTVTESGGFERRVT